MLKLTTTENRRLEKLKGEIFRQVKIAPHVPVILTYNDFDFFARAISGEDKKFNGDQCHFGKTIVKRAPKDYV